MEYIAVIGVEIHLELLTKSKMFSSSMSSYNQAPNTMVSPIDLALPGTLPTVNKKAVEQAIKIASVLHCQIDNTLYFDRKNYFYPDLPKGYQITQDYRPIGTNGYLIIEVQGESKRIGISRLQIEEDTAKQIHKDDYTLLDYNRAGLPLVEIVTDASFSQAAEVEAYITLIRNLTSYLEVSDAKMEEGSLRCDINISLMPKGSKKWGTKVEIKNLNSISNVVKAIEFEIARQAALLNEGKKVSQETRRYDDVLKATVFMRDKSNAIDYKYFIEPNIPPIKLSKEFMDNVINSIGELPDVKIKKMLENGLNLEEATQIVYNKSYRLLMEKINGNHLKIATNLLLGDIQAYLNANNKKIDEMKLTANHLNELAEAIIKEEVSSKHYKLIIKEMLENGDSLAQILQNHNLIQISDSEGLRAVVVQVLASNPQAIIDIREGRNNAYQYLIGQIFKATKGQANPKIASQLVKEEVLKLL